MGIPRSLWWVVVTGTVVAALVGLSWLALDKPDVVWSAAADSRPVCPHCRSAVPFYAHRCPTCREEFDWVVSPEEDSPACRSCLSAEEARWLALRRKALGDEETVRRLAAATPLTTDGARAWLHAIEPGRCGRCGGTGRDGASGSGGTCPVCFGEGKCISCDESLHVRRGNERAGREWSRFEVRVREAPVRDAVFDLRAYVRDWNEKFLRKCAGTEEAGYVLLWPQVPEDLGGGGGVSLSNVPRAATAARQRIEAALGALRK